MKSVTTITVLACAALSAPSWAQGVSQQVQDVVAARETMVRGRGSCQLPAHWVVEWCSVLLEPRQCLGAGSLAWAISTKFRCPLLTATIAGPNNCFPSTLLV
jgi:hypothetical protein